MFSLPIGEFQVDMWMIERSYSTNHPLKDSLFYLYDPKSPCVLTDRLEDCHMIVNQSGYGEKKNIREEASLDYKEEERQVELVNTKTFLLQMKKEVNQNCLSPVASQSFGDLQEEDQAKMKQQAADLPRNLPEAYKKDHKNLQIYQGSQSKFLSKVHQSKLIDKKVSAHQGSTPILNVSQSAAQNILGHIKHLLSKDQSLMKQLAELSTKDIKSSEELLEIIKHILESDHNSNQRQQGNHISKGFPDASYMALERVTVVFLAYLLQKRPSEQEKEGDNLEQRKQKDLDEEKS